MKNLKKNTLLTVIFLAVILGTAIAASAQDGSRVIKQTSSRPINQPPAPSQPSTDKTKTLSSSAPINSPTARPVLTNTIEVAKPETPQPLVKKTGSSSPVNMLTSLAAGRVVYSAAASSQMLKAIQERIGIPYRYGATGPNRYDCSGFVWAVFHDAGILFERTSAKSLWSMSEPVEGDERYKFGTLVFFNSLGHIGIVADENGFYQASSSKGITYSPFAGYWEKRIVGFRRLIQKN